MLKDVVTGTTDFFDSVDISFISYFLILLVLICSNSEVGTGPRQKKKQGKKSKRKKQNSV